MRQIADTLKARIAQVNTSYVFDSGPDRQRLQLSRPGSIEPMEFEFRFGHYGAAAVRLLKQMDEILLLTHSMRHQNLLTVGEWEQHRNRARRQMRRVLNSGESWRHTGVTRQDLKSRNQAGRQAVEKLTQSRLLDMEMYRDVEEACEVFAEYAGEPGIRPKIGRPGRACAEEARVVEDGAAQN